MNKRSYDRVIRALTPLALALLLVVCVSGVFIYPYLFATAGLGHATLSPLASKLLITALAAQIAALGAAIFTSFAREHFSITVTLVRSLTAAVFFSWAAMLVQRISPLNDIAGFSGAVLSVMFTALIGSVLSVVPAILATLAAVLRRIAASLLSDRRR